ncbi:MAG TPA: hypothetical protein VGC75_01720 [Candidatus Nitrosocosmicus sp.]
MFPDTYRLMKFLLLNKLSHVEVNSNQRSLTAFLSDNQIVIAETKYKAILHHLLA